MTQPDIIQTILKDSDYHLDLFTDTEVQALREKIFIKTVRGKETPHIKCTIRNKDIQLKPEELIRQLYAERLLNRYNYPQERVRFEHLVNFGRERKRADIVILDKDRPDTPYIIVEVRSRNSKTVKTNSVPTATRPARPSPYGQTGSKFRTITEKTRIILKRSPIFPSGSNPR